MPAIPAIQPVAKTGCNGCRNGEGLDFDFTMAFQPIVDVVAHEVFAHEALVRGLEGEGAFTVLARVDAGNRYAFDQACRVKAIELASALGMSSRLSINFMPNAVYRAEACIRATLEAARRHAFPVERIMFELTEDERAHDLPHITSIFREYARQGFVTAIDDFGAGYAGLQYLAEFRPDVIKLDMGLVRNIDTDTTRRTIVAGMTRICGELGIRVLAEGVETVGELHTLRTLGIELFQGYLFARPQVNVLPPVNWAALTAH